MFQLIPYYYNAFAEHYRILIGTKYFKLLYRKNS